MIRIIAFQSFLLRSALLLMPSVAFGFAELFCLLMPEVLTSDANPAHGTEYFLLLLLATFTWMLSVGHYGLQGLRTGFDGCWDRLSCVRACAATYLTLLAATFLIPVITFPRRFLLLSAAAHLALSLLLAAAIRRARRVRLRSAAPIQVLIVGADEFALRTGEKLCQSGAAPCKIAGYVRLPWQAAEITNGRLLEFDQIEAFAIGKQVDDIVVALPAERMSEFSGIVESLNSLSIPVRAVLDFGNVHLNDRVFRFGELQMLDLHRAPSESLVYLLLKRWFDIAFAVLAILVTSPLMISIAILVRLTSPGPILFVQERVGLNGQIFHMYKFRTMRVAGGNEADVRWTVRDDPRRTRLGTLLRRTSLDELPQFFNVLRGDMSVVGPRPERPYFVEKFARQYGSYHQRHQLKVGITGWAQINGCRGDSSIAARLDHDLYYLQNWSLGFDLKIVLLTVIRGMFAHNAY